MPCCRRCEDELDARTYEANQDMMEERDAEAREENEDDS
jgi:hypothetical protein